MSDSPRATVTFDNHIAHVRLTRADKMNAVDDAMINAVIAAGEEVAASDARVCVISGEGKGGPAGYAKGGAKVTLEPIEGGTRLSYEVEANVGGKIAQLGGRLITSTAKKLSKNFFEKFEKVMTGEVEINRED